MKKYCTLILKLFAIEIKSNNFVPMRSHWESSEKSLYVRTVWINGVRHAILSKNDPALLYNIQKRPYSCGQNVRYQPKRSINYYDTSTASTTPSSNNMENEDEEESYKTIDSLRLETFSNEHIEILKTNKNDTTGDRKKMFRKIQLPNLHNNETIMFTNNSINPITDRVLNWLDLAHREHSSVDVDDKTRYVQHNEHGVNNQWNNTKLKDRTNIRNRELNYLGASKIINKLQKNFNQYKNEFKQNKHVLDEDDAVHDDDIQPNLFRHKSYDESTSERRHSSWNVTTHSNSYDLWKSESNLSNKSAQSNDFDKNISKKKWIKYNCYSKNENQNNYESKLTRTNEQIIRKNNENINKLMQNIYTFKHNNELHQTHFPFFQNNQTNKDPSLQTESTRTNIDEFLRNKTNTNELFRNRPNMVNEYFRNRTNMYETDLNENDRIRTNESNHCRTKKNEKGKLRSKKWKRHGKVCTSSSGEVDYLDRDEPSYDFVFIRDPDELGYAQSKQFHSLKTGVNFNEQKNRESQCGGPKHSVLYQHNLYQSKPNVTKPQLHIFMPTI